MSQPRCTPGLFRMQKSLRVTTLSGGAPPSPPSPPRRPNTARGTQHDLLAATVRRAPKLDSSATAGVTLPIPDTVVYEHDFPQAWFTYHRKLNEIVKRSGKFLDATQIYRGFSTVHPASGGICAQFCATSVNAETGQPETTVMYLSPSNLESMLFKRGGAWAQYNKEGILQKFVPPRGDCNDAMQVVWSPRVTVVSAA